MLSVINVAYMMAKDRGRTIGTSYTKSIRVKSSSFFWSHWSHASNFFTPGVFVKQNSNRTVF